MPACSIQVRNTNRFSNNACLLYSGQKHIQIQQPCLPALFRLKTHIDSATCACIICIQPDYSDQKHIQIQQPCLPAPFRFDPLAESTIIPTLVRLETHIDSATCKCITCIQPDYSGQKHIQIQQPAHVLHVFSLTIQARNTYRFSNHAFQHHSGQTHLQSQLSYLHYSGQKTLQSTTTPTLFRLEPLAHSATISAPFRLYMFYLVFAKVLEETFVCLIIHSTKSILADVAETSDLEHDRNRSDPYLQIMNETVIKD